MRRAALMTAAAALLVAAAWLGAVRGPARADGAGAPVLDDAFWKHWGDGRAEVSSYDLTFPRYGEPRRGTAVAIFVTETFSEEARVKADPGRHARADEFPVMKLNLLQDFPTGIYDYSLMSSVFVGLEAKAGRPAGTPAKLVFSAQEWCGLVHHQLLPDARRARSVAHSYFDGEADRAETLPLPDGAVFEDALYLWARGLAGPGLAPGESASVPMVRSLERVRLTHVPLARDPVTLARSAGTTRVEVPAGAFDVETWTATAGGDAPRTWTFHVEAAPPHRIVRWECTDGRRAELVAGERLRYWEMNDAASIDALARLGLSARPPRTP